MAPQVRRRRNTGLSRAGVRAIAGTRTGGPTGTGRLATTIQRRRRPVPTAVPDRPVRRRAGLDRNPAGRDREDQNPAGRVDPDLVQVVMDRVPAGRDPGYTEQGPQGMGRDPGHPEQGHNRAHPNRRRDHLDRPLSPSTGRLHRKRVRLHQPLTQRGRHRTQQHPQRGRHRTRRRLRRTQPRQMRAHPIRSRPRRSNRTIEAAPKR